MPPGIPGNLRFSKVYYEPHLAAIKLEEDEAQQLGQGAADEWRKGLYNKGKDAMADSARWEKWEAQLRLGANPAQVLREYDPSSFPHRVPDVQSKPAAVSTAQLPLTANGKLHSFLLCTCHGVVLFLMQSLFFTLATTAVILRGR